MKIIIIEDEKLTAADLAATVVSLRPDTQILAMLHSVAEAKDFFTGPHDVADVIFSDIQLGDGTAFDLFAAIHTTIPVIYCTAYNEHALQAFQSNGINYILKPFTAQTIEAALSRYDALRETMAGRKVGSATGLEETHDKNDGNKKNIVMVYHLDRIIPINAEDIAFISFKSGNAHLTAFDERSFVLTHTMDELEAATGELFYRLNRQYLVNRNSIGEVKHVAARKLAVTLTLASNEVIIISKEKKTSFLQWLKS